MQRFFDALIFLTFCSQGCLWPSLAHRGGRPWDKIVHNTPLPRRKALPLQEIKR